MRYKILKWKILNHEEKLGILEMLLLCGFKIGNSYFSKIDGYFIIDTIEKTFSTSSLYPEEDSKFIAYEDMEVFII